jgi:type VI secretion system protein ImpE
LDETLKNGDIAAALADLQNQVRGNPADPKLRVYLFQLLCVLGQWDRALTQLNVCGEMDDATLSMVQTYQEAIQAEAFRADVFAGKRNPLLMGKPEEWIALLVEANRLLATGEIDAAVKLREQAYATAPASPGKLSLGEAEDQTFQFAWLADADSRLGPLLEVIINGKYYWVPMNHISEVKFEEPEDLRDYVWTPAFFTWQNGGQAPGLIPTRYPSLQTDDAALLMAKKTDWQTMAGETYLGLGQRMLTTDQDGYALMDIRSIELEAGIQSDGSELI